MKSNVDTSDRITDYKIKHRLVAVRSNSHTASNQTQARKLVVLVFASLLLSSSLLSHARSVVFFERQKLTASDAIVNKQFGESVAVDGDTAVIGARTFRADAAGSVHVFVRNDTGFSEQQRLQAKDANNGDRFGSAAAISGDTIVVGAPGTGSDTGSAYVFVREGTTWVEQQKLAAGDAGAEDSFGLSVAIDGDTIIVAAPFDDVGANENQGSAYVFVRQGATWTERQKLVASDGEARELFGHPVAGPSVAIEGDTTIVGAFGERTNSLLPNGAIYVFARTGETFSEQQKLLASRGENFGASVAICGDTLIGGDTGFSGNEGAAYVFVRNGATFTEQQMLVPSEDAAFFGASVAIIGDLAVVGAVSSDSVFVFERSGNVWTEKQILRASDGERGDRFGNSVAMSGETVLIGAPRDDIDSVTDQGSAYIFTPPDPANCTITCHANITVQVVGRVNSAIVNFPDPAASVDCIGATVACFPPSGSSFPQGTTTVTCAATGAAATCAFTVTVTVFDICLQDNSNGNLLLFNTASGAYLFTRCSDGFTVTGTGTVTIKGSFITLQHNATDRRLLAKLDDAQKKGSATLQLFALAATLTINDTNTTNNTCSCQ